MAIPLEDIQAAQRRVQGYAHKTPVMTSQSIDRMLPGNDDRSRKIFFKCENLQRVGAFKIRGAVNAVSRLMEETPSLKGVVTHSSGNHAQALALAAKMKGVPAHIVMPRTAPAVKRRAVEDTYGAKVYVCEPTQQAREAMAGQVVQATGGVFVHPYNNRMVQEGQGTAGLEFMEQTNNELDAVVIAVGGGGMMTGMASAIKAMKPTCRVFGAEPEGADDAARSVKAGRILGHLQGKPNTIADGLLTVLGDTTFPAVKELAEDIITVSEAEIAVAMKHIMERMKLVVEPSAAVPLAAVFSRHFPKDVKNIGVVLCGGNLDLLSIPRYLSLIPSEEQQHRPKL